MFLDVLHVGRIRCALGAIASRHPPAWTHSSWNLSAIGPAHLSEKRLRPSQAAFWGTTKLQSVKATFHFAVPRKVENSPVDFAGILIVVNEEK